MSCSEKRRTAHQSTASMNAKAEFDERRINKISFGVIEDNTERKKSMKN
jgi:hypothetical protein